MGKWELPVGMCVWKAEQWWKGFITMDLYNCEGFYTWSELRILKKHSVAKTTTKKFFIGKETE